MHTPEILLRSRRAEQAALRAVAAFFDAAPFFLPSFICLIFSIEI